MGQTTILRKPSGDYDCSLCCPWCGVTSGSLVKLHSQVVNQYFFVAGCQASACRKTVLVRLYMHNWQNDANYPAEVYPRATASYAAAGVPPEIARDFQEALGCQLSGYNYAVALVARRVLQAAARDVNSGAGANLAAEINAIDGARLSQVLKDAAHEVRYIGNDAAHANGIDAGDVEHLMTFTEQLLEALYVIPAKVAAARAKRTGAGPATPPTS